MTIAVPGLRVLVTGGAAGIGLAIAETLSAGGAKVAVADMSAEHLQQLRDSNSSLLTAQADVSSPQSLEPVFDMISREFGGLDALINNAGITGPFGRIEDIPVADWEKTIAVNVNGAFFVTRLAVPMIKKAGGGAIINISSIAGRLGYALRTPYSAAKWALTGLTQSLAMELGPDNIRVNAILPGFVSGPRHMANAQRRADLLGISVEEQRQRVLSRISLRQLTSPQDVANAAAFLLSEYGAHISGQSLGVCGNVESLGG